MGCKIIDAIKNSIFDIFEESGVNKISIFIYI